MAEQHLGDFFFLMQFKKSIIESLPPASRWFTGENYNNRHRHKDHDKDKLLDHRSQNILS